MLNRRGVDELQAHAQQAHLQLASALTGINLRAEAEDLPLSQDAVERMEEAWRNQLTAAAVELNACRLILNKGGKNRED